MYCLGRQGPDSETNDVQGLFDSAGSRRHLSSKESMWVDLCSPTCLSRTSADSYPLANRSHVHVTHHTCLKCGRSLTIPAIPDTSMPEVDLPGGRRKRRTRAVLHEKEKQGPDSEGHSLWRNDTITKRWGIIHDDTETKAFFNNNHCLHKAVNIAT